MSDALLQCEGLVKHYSPTSFWSPRTRAAVRAVDGVDLMINPGEIIGLVGESGCGKSTLARLLVRLEVPTRGRVLFGGQDTAHLSSGQNAAIRKAIQLIFQDPKGSLDPRLSASDIIAEPLRIHRSVPGREAIFARVNELMERVGLDPSTRFRYPHEFSGGQCQRIGIARALAAEPRLLVCDEAVSALDVSVQAQIVGLLRSLCTDLGMAMLFISHDLALVNHVAGRVVVMQSGRIVEDGTSEQICLRPKHPHTQQLVACARHFQASNQPV